VVTPSFVSRSNLEVKATLNLSSDAAPLLPRAWPLAVKSAIFHGISLGRLALVHTRSWAVDSPSSRLRLESEVDETRSEIALLREEIRIKDARRTLVRPHRRPRYPPTERLSILELRATRAWSAAQTARTFMLEPATIAEWTGRLDEGGDSALVKTAEPVNRFPDFVRHRIRRLKTISPSMGKKRGSLTSAVLPIDSARA
jgi:transposase-like protein